jgi:hypothetical protein
MSRLCMLTAVIILMLLAVSCMAPPDASYTVLTHSDAPSGQHPGAGSEPSHDVIRIEADTVQAAPQFSSCAKDAVSDNSIPLPRSSRRSTNHDLSRPHTIELSNIQVLRI